VGLHGGMATGGLFVKYSDLSGVYHRPSTLSVHFCIGSPPLDSPHLFEPVQLLL
jgi:hypothetical protein